MPSERSAVNSQPPAASAPRTATMSITFFALYFSSRATTVNSTSRAGLEMAKFAVRCSAWKAITTASTGAAASTAKPAGEHERQQRERRADAEARDQLAGGDELHAPA